MNSDKNARPETTPATPVPASPTARPLMQQDLLRRGWTRSMIVRLLVAPDTTEHRYGGGTITLYRVDRVEAAERTPVFEELRAQGERRSLTAKAAAERRKAERLAALEKHLLEHPCVVPEYGADELVDRACASYNRLPRSIENDSHAWPHSDPAFLARIQVNYLRHECTDYEDGLAQQYCEIGADEARSMVRDHVLDAIADAYPDLSGECIDQMFK